MEYDGTDYCGWQRQKGDRSIQATLESALQEINRGEPVGIIGAGRTDSGVHAFGQVAHFELDTRLLPSDIRNALNAKTPRDILVHDCQEVAEDFHARYSARRRRYIYKVLTRRSAIGRSYSWQLEFEPDIEVLARCAELVLGEHDFTSLSRASAEVDSKICLIYESRWSREEDMLLYTIQGNRFLYSMVRLLVGTMMEVSRGRYSPEDFENLLGNKAVGVQLYKAPAQGLFLLNVEY